MKPNLSAFALMAFLVASGCKSTAGSALGEFVPPPIVPIPDRSNRDNRRLLEIPSQVPIFSADREEFVQEGRRLRRAMGALLDGVDSERVVVLVHHCRPLKASPLLRSDEQAAVVQALQTAGGPFWATDFDNQARYEELAVVTDPGRVRDWASPHWELIGEMSVLDEREIERERELELGVLMKIVHTVFEPTIRITKRSDLTVMRFTLRARNARTKLYPPDAQARITAILAKSTTSTRSGLLIGDSGISLSGTSTFLDGSDQASDIIVSRATLTVLSRLIGAPLHRCIRNASPDPLVEDAARSVFRSMPPSSQAAQIQHLLRLNEFPVAKTGSLDNPTRVALGDYSRRFSIPYSPEFLPDVYVHLLNHSPLPFEPLAIGPSTSPSAPAGLDIIFQGFPSQYQGDVEGVVRSLAGRGNVYIHDSDPFGFHVDVPAPAREWADPIRTLFFRRTGRQCFVDPRDPNRAVVKFTPTALLQ